jgi:hypothetical protein
VAIKGKGPSLQWSGEPHETKRLKQLFLTLALPNKKIKLITRLGGIIENLQPEG